MERVRLGRYSCHDEQCGARHRCERWLTKDAAGMLHAMTLKEAWLPHEAACSHILRHRMSMSELAEHGPAGWLVAGWLLGVKPETVWFALLDKHD